MQEIPQERYTVARRVLFPYSGAEPLSRRQGAYVITVWSLVFASIMSLCTFLIGLLGAVSSNKLLLLLLVSFLSGIFVFGMLAWVIVSMNNRAARLHKAWKVAKASSDHGGNYGS